MRLTAKFHKFLVFAMNQAYFEHSRASLLTIFTKKSSSADVRLGTKYSCHYLHIPVGVANKFFRKMEIAIQHHCMSQNQYWEFDIEYPVLYIHTASICCSASNCLQ